MGGVRKRGRVVVGGVRIEGEGGGGQRGRVVVGGVRIEGRVVVDRGVSSIVHLLSQMRLTMSLIMWSCD